MSVSQFVRLASRHAFLRGQGSVIALQRRHLAAESSPLITVVEDKDIATVHLNRPPVNTLNHQLVSELTSTIQRLEKSDTCRGMILTSSVPNIFSGGIDLSVMYPIKAEKYARYWRDFQQLWMTLYGTKLATLAAVNGHAPAGGCFLSMSCDYRVMSSGAYKIGLNESQIGIMIPSWFQDVFIKVVGRREAEKALQLGHMYSAEEALAVGLVDKVVDPNEVQETAKKELTKFLRVDDVARALTKQSMRRASIEKLLNNREDDIGIVVRFISQDSIQKGIGRYLDSLQKRPR